VITIIQNQPLQLQISLRKYNGDLCESDDVGGVGPRITLSCKKQDDFQSFVNDGYSAVTLTPISFSNSSIYDSQLSYSHEGDYWFHTLSSTLYADLTTKQDFSLRILANIKQEPYFEVKHLQILEKAGQYTFSNEVAIEVKQTQNFYRHKLKGFFPESERYYIQKDQRYNLFIETFGNFLDKLDQIVEKINSLTDINTIDDEYLRYLAQIVGYETEDFSIASIALRNLIREIFAIYNSRGTVGGFESFFKSLGYAIRVEEKWYSGSTSIVTEKPRDTVMDLAVLGGLDELWKWSHVYGSQVAYSSTIDPDIDPSKIEGALDLIRTDDDRYRFVQLLPTPSSAETYEPGKMDYTFDANVGYRKDGFFNKSERLTSLIVEPLKESEFVPDILNQMLVYIDFLKPVHIKMVLSLYRDFVGDDWWEEIEDAPSTGTPIYTPIIDTIIQPKFDEDGNITNPEFSSQLILDSNVQSKGTIKRDIDSLDITVGFYDSGVGDESMVMEGEFHKEENYGHVGLLLNGEMTLSETQSSQFDLTNNTAWMFGDDVYIIAHSVIGVTPNSAIYGQSVILNTNDQQYSYVLPW